MEDIYKDDPNSWLRRTRFTKTGYTRHPLLKPGSSNYPNSNQASTSMTVTRDDNTSKTTQTTTTSNFKLSYNPDSCLTSEVPVGSNSRTSKKGQASMHGAVSDMFKEVKNTIRRKFMAPPPRERKVKSSSRKKEKSQGMKKYLDREVCQVGALEKSSENDWTPDISELIRWKEMASRVRCPLFREDNARLPESGHED